MSASARTRRCTLLVAGDPSQRTGGYLYDARIAAGLRERGWTVAVIGLAGRFPRADAQARDELAAALAALPDASLVLLDGLVMGDLGEVLRAQRQRLRMVALLHHPLADEGGLDAAERSHFLASEGAALAEVAAVITTSAFTARRLAGLGWLRGGCTVVEPGVAAAPLASAAGEPPRLLCVASLSPRKAQDVLLAALVQNTHLAWQCELVGSRDRDPAFAAQLDAQLRAYHLHERVSLTGELAEPDLQAAYGRADLFVLASRYEGYGMVITEALAHGLPVLCTSGGALAETLPPGAGLQVPPDDLAALAAALRRLLGDRELRLELREGARRARHTLRDWSAAAADFEHALDAIPAEAGT